MWCVHRGIGSPLYFSCELHWKTKSEIFCSSAGVRGWYVNVSFVFRRFMGTGSVGYNPSVCHHMYLSSWICGVVSLAGYYAAVGYRSCGRTEIGQRRQQTRILCRSCDESCLQESLESTGVQELG
eukprot:PhF_6_TR32958/c0_g1_i1/m.48500